MPWQRDRLKMLPAENQPKWMKQEITDTTSDTYSVFLQLDEETTAVLAAVGVHRGGCEIALMRAVLPYTPGHRTAEDAETAGISELPR